ncbi:MAG TPA: hypothetical protein ENJ18_05890 [Nannocystis exedens]|nr:hypothetical protein [Nannocystis exedens]
MNPLSLFWREQGDLEVSRLQVDDCSVPLVEIDEVEVQVQDEQAGEAATASASGEMRVVAKFLAVAGDPAELDPESVALRLDGAELSMQVEAETSVELGPESGRIEVVIAGLGRGRHSLQINAADLDGRQAVAVRALGWVQPVANEWAGGTIYQVIIDRYRGDGGAWLDPPADPGARAGGTLAGVRASIEDGRLERLGVSAIWLSPVYAGPTEARKGRDDDYLYSNYHGYWVLDNRAVEPAIGGELALHELIDSAHRHGIRVLLDIVPNHIYEDNPWAAELAAEDGINRRDPLCVCGAADCSWADSIQTCWFTDYLPDLRLKRAFVMAQVVADVIWWADTFDLDGVRIDAVPMMPRAATRRIAAGLRSSARPDDAYFLIGEVFTGPGAWGIDVIRYYLGPDGIDSVFDFPLMWTLRDVIANKSAGFAAVEAILQETEMAVEGSGAVLGRMIGNHDTSRFISEIVGDADLDPWTTPPVQPTNAAAYERQGLALGLGLMLSGLAVIYYGDEVGLAGGDDPDCRRVMPAEHTLMPAQLALRAQTERLGQLRRCLPALGDGVRRVLVASGDLYVFVRDRGDGQPVLVAMNRGDTVAIASFDLDTEPSDFVDVLGGELLELGGGPQTLDLAPRTMRVFVPANSRCAAAL